jgi:transcriptional regulator with XRE-family HTH domain
MQQTLGQYIKQLRRARGWSQENLASEIGVSTPAVHSVEVNRSVLRAAAFGKLLNVFSADRKTLRAKYALQLAANACCRGGVADVWDAMEARLRLTYNKDRNNEDSPD